MQGKIMFILAVVIVMASLGVMFVQMRSQVLAGDEAIFIRMTQHLPTYRSYPEWFTREGNIHPDDCDYIPPSDFYQKAYDDPIWHHPPLAHYLAYPFVTMFFSNETIATIDAGIDKLRQVAWAMLSFCIVGALYIVRKVDKTSLVLLLAAIPILTGLELFFQWGNNWFYHDMFMLFFLVIALLMRKTKYEKYIYIPLSMMVLCKLTGMFFLIPFVIENKKRALCALAIIPFLIQCYFVAGDFFYPITHYINACKFSLHGTIRPIIYGLQNATMIISVTIVPFLYLVWQAIAKRVDWFLPILYVVALMVGLVFGGQEYMMTPLMIVGVIIMGRAASIFISSRRVVKC